MSPKFTSFWCILTASRHWQMKCNLIFEPYIKWRHVIRASTHANSRLLFVGEVLQILLDFQDAKFDSLNQSLSTDELKVAPHIWEARHFGDDVSQFLKVVWYGLEEILLLTTFGARFIFGEAHHCILRQKARLQSKLLKKILTAMNTDGTSEIKGSHDSQKYENILTIKSFPNTSNVCKSLSFPCPMSSSSLTCLKKGKTNYTNHEGI